MRRTVGYILMAAVFLGAVFCLHAVKYAADQEQAARAEHNGKTAAAAAAEDDFSTRLPLVVIDTGDAIIQKDEPTWAKIWVIDNTQGENRLTDPPTLTAAAVIKYRGSSSYNVFDKKQYRIEFRQAQGQEKTARYALMGMGAASDWVLNGPFLDRTLMRNRLAFSISRQMLSWAPDTRFCEVYLNGRYQGVYVMIEPVTNEETRLNLTDFSLVSGRTAYILKRDRDATEDNVIQTYGTLHGLTANELSISYPTATRLTEKNKQYIIRDVSAFEEALYSEQFADPAVGYAAYIDVASFVDYYLINEFTMTTDAGHLSTYIYKDMDSKLKMTVWDFNNAFDNYMWSVKSTQAFYITGANWYERLFQDRAFVTAVIARYRQLRQGVLSEERILDMVDQYQRELGDAITRNFTLWGYTFYEDMLSDDAQGNSRDPENYAQALAQLKQCVIDRGSFMDEHMEDLYQYCIN
jgi:spore coat protein H